MPKPTAAQMTAVIDEFGELSRKAALFKPTADRLEALKEEIRSWYADQPGDFTTQVSGQLYDVQVGPRRNERKVSNMAKLFRLVGRAAFLARCSFPLKSIDELFAGKPTPFLVEDRTGNRDIKAVARMPLQKAA